MVPPPIVGPKAVAEFLELPSEKAGVLAAELRNALVSARCTVALIPDSDDRADILVSLNRIDDLARELLKGVES